MAKIFIDTDILPKAFRKLEPSLKLAWYYIWTHSDKSGVWDIDSDLFEFDNGINFDLDKFKESFKGLVEIKNEKILLKDFIKVNYGTLTDNYNPHKPVFRDLAKNKIKLEPSLNQACFKLEEEDKDKEEDKKEDEGEKKKLPEKQKFDFEQVIKIFNSVCHKLPSVQSLTEPRKAAIKNRASDYGLTGIGDVFQKVSLSRFLTGENDKGWKADFDWIMKPANFIKILEGKYENNENGNNKSNEQIFTDAMGSEVGRNFKFK